MKKVTMIVLAALAVALTVQVAAASESDVCPEGGGWVKVDGLSGLSYTFTPPDGYVVVENCMKVGSHDPVFGTGATVTNSTLFNSPQGAVCTAPGVPHQGCALQAISHASFKLKKDYSTTTTTEAETTTTAGETTTTQGETTTTAGETTTTAGETTTTAGETTTTAGETTTTTLATTTTTQNETTTTQPETTTTGPTTTEPQTAEWSAGSTCDSLSVQFGEGILQVDAYNDGFLLDTFTEPGTREVVVGAPFIVELVPIAAAGYEAVPATLTFTFDHCTPGPSTIPPTTDPAEVLPFTGAPPIAALVVIGLSALVLGGLMARGRKGDDVDLTG